MIPPGVHFETYRPGHKPLKTKTKKRFRFLFRGALRPQSGVDVVLRAFLASFSRKDDVALLLHCTDGDFMLDRIREYAASTETRVPEVEFYSDKLDVEGGDESRTLGLMAASHLLVAPFRAEQTSVHILEAMAFSLPVMVSAHASTLDFCNTTSCFMVPVAEKPCKDEPCGEKSVFGLPTAKQPLWAEPDVAALGRQMMYAYTHPEVCLCYSAACAHAGCDRIYARRQSRRIG